MQTGRDRTGGLSPEDFAALGVQGIAYVRRVLERVDAKAGAKGGEPIVVFAIHSADGERIGGAPSRDLAFAAVRQHGLEPVDAH
ncbi:MAG: DUF1150 family protein [Alphaproteobacteria bacterium]|nr:DUF1150 family protein [Alphaproteobacteria bacterium]